MKRLAPTDAWTALVIFALMSSIYFATISGITSSNDGSHYALVRALVDDQSFRIDPYLDFTENQDYATRDGVFYSDRPPGTALLTAPFYMLGQIAPKPLSEIPSKHDADNPLVLYAVLSAALFAAGAISVFYLLLRQHFDVPLEAALLACAALGLGTTFWKYGTVLYSHAASALVLITALYLMMLATRTKSLTYTNAMGLGLLLGLAPVVEYTNVPFVLIVGLYLLVQLRSTKLGWWVTLAAAAAVPIGFLLFYNTVNFGGPLEFSRFYADTTLWPENEDLNATFTTPILYGMRALLWFVPDDPNQGLFLLSPIALLGLVGWPVLLKKHRREAPLLLIICVGYLALFATSTTFNPATNDGRYITPFIPIWFIGVAAGIGWIWQNQVRWLRYTLGVVTLILLMVSIQQQFWHIAFSWNYDLSPEMLAPLAASPQNIGLVWATVFPNALNLPLLWAGYAIIITLIVLIKRRRHVTTDPALSTQ